MAEIFDDVRPKIYYTPSPGWTGSLPEFPQGSGSYWGSVEPRKEGQTRRDNFGGGQYIDFVWRSDRFRAGRGSSVAHIQNRLNARRVSGAPAALNPDGVWGSLTSDMVRWFQRHTNSMLALAGSTERLTVDGVVGAKTWSYLA